MREIVLDTETTGLDPADGHRVIEIGCVELEGHVPTGNTFQRYLDPERLVGGFLSASMASPTRSLSASHASLRWWKTSSASSATRRW